ncbi:MAG: prepilin-type N-terminal cleavage/methylation domain-containing protein [Elusimicrobiaceae bacterium]|nr:prepilin-type N-terminal cleavage/methylation domain-containing protein [Elusimicrobiaceae bacterium]
MHKAFTLVELLVVVLIIGILSAIAIPMYQGAVDKSHWSTMLPGAKAIKDAEEAIKMTNGAYTDNMANLDVTMNNTDLTFALVTPNNTADPNVIRVTNSKLANVRLASYLNDSPIFAGQLHCEAKTGDERAEKLCGKLLIGQDLTSAEGYTAYLLDQAIDKATCDHVGRAFSQKNGTCYRTDQERCSALAMPYQANGIYGNSTPFCGYGASSNVEVNEGGICKGYIYNSCNNSSFKDGGVCWDMAKAGCTNSSFANGAVCITKNESSCANNTFDNAICVTTSFYGGCDSTFTNGSVCYAGESTYYRYGCAGVSYNDNACCCGGASCPNEHRCSSARCAEVEAQVQNISTQYGINM